MSPGNCVLLAMLSTYGHPTRIEFESPVVAGVSTLQQHFTTMLHRFLNPTETKFQESTGTVLASA
jgi:hypothetical protein